jgi:hypothetical protein
MRLRRREAQFVPARPPKARDGSSAMVISFAQSDPDFLTESEKRRAE